MTPEAQRIAIAEALRKFHEKKGPRAGCWLEWDGGDQRITIDPLNDLNAMHEAEKVLTERQKEEYAAISLPRSVGVTWACFSYVHATAAQRAEAFLRTIGKWEDSQ